MAKAPNDKRQSKAAGGAQPAAGAPAAELVLVGKFGSARGVRGEIRIRSFTEDPLALTYYGDMFAAGGTRRIRIQSARLLKDAVLIARIEGIETRQAAEALTNLDLYVPRAALPPAGEDEFYYSDLAGLEARLASGERFGTVVRVENFGAGDILEILRTDGQEFMLAFTRANVPDIDIKNGYLVVILPAEIEARDEPGKD